MTTTTGSIDARLTIDTSDFERGAAEARREAAELGALSPEIEVSADASAAIAQMAATVSEADRVALASGRVELASDRVRLAQMRLDEVTGNANATDRQRLQAQIGLASAQQSLATATSRLAEATENDTAATDRNEASHSRADRANRRHVSGIQVLIALSPGILAAAAPIGAAAIGLGAAFGVMAVSGVAAVAGIKREMESGTAVGDQYAAGLTVLKGDLDLLSRTSAVAMLDSFTTSVGDINARMPFLNQLLGESSAQLGQIGGTALRGMLDGLQAMNPLIQAGGVELGKFVGWLSSFSNTPGFQSFVSYAVTNLPSVTDMLQNLVTLGGNILAAFAPLGPVVIGMISGLADGLNSVPLPVLAGLVTSTLLLGPALRLAFASEVAKMIGVVAAQIGLTGVMANLAVPVVGILTAALAGIGIMAATAAIGTQQGTAALTDYTQALRADSDAIGENVRATAAKALSDAGAFAAAKELGINQKTLTDAVLGSADAINQVNDAARRGKDFVNDWSQGVMTPDGMYVATDAQNKMGKSIEIVTGQLGTQSGAIAKSKQDIEDQAAATDKNTAATEAKIAADERAASVLGVTVAAIQGAKKAQEDHKAAADAATLALQLENNAAGLLKQAFDELNGKSLGLEQAQTRAAAATNSVSASFVQNGVAIAGGTAAAVANQQALQNKVAADQAAAEAVAKATGSTEEGTKAYGASKAALEESMRAQGLLTEEVQGYINKLYDVNNFKPKPVELEVQKAKAEADIAAFQARVDALRGKTIDIITRNSSVEGGTGPSGGAVGKAGQVVGFATGGPVPEYLVTGGHPGGPRGTDTVAAWLTPNEFVMNRASAQSIGTPALNYMNQTGQLPPAAAAAPGPAMFEGNLYLDSGEFLGKVRGIAKQEAGAAIGSVARSIGRGASV
ncbi:hypothetical protein [Arthrobacter cavernae]|uniref:Uncharacterized protein n=1 Tax=Arthrobacter cavernae TaxID=2817681 RepID=A0A939KNS6_9MICC|nr:hypothetical protein [Arthrobacter cavernae]MBO1269608.1 hypothetical protein [Arthrobacter cavernae]